MLFYLNFIAPTGYPASEASAKRSTAIQILNREEIESMREVCRVWVLAFICEFVIGKFDVEANLYWCGNQSFSARTIGA